MPTPIPTGRYAVLVGDTRLLIKLTRVTSNRQYTTVEVAFPADADGVWGEVVVPETKMWAYEVLRGVDLGTASYMYTCITHKCGVCYRPTRKPHDRCISKRYPS